MPIYHTRKRAESYGHELGVLLLDVEQPFVPGDVGNASTWKYPVLYRTVPGCDIERLIYRNESDLREAVVETAKDLEAQGVRGITSNCGFLLRHQEAAARAVRVPVFLSSLLQLPMMLSAFARTRPVGVMTASQGSLTPELLRLAGVDPEHDPVHGFGMDRYPSFDEPFMQDSGTVDTDALERDIAELARHMLDVHPDMGAILLECADLTPYGHAVQQATGLPVFDFATLVDFYVATQNRPRYRGNY
ncbi:aspartate/glutamate racemase family protein [Rhodovibrio salinarum]|uniref:Aspartate/glutamate racemase family protein n=1 Tax=Rhodovibrio salinarum TaxID=1087 RepID=A0A934V321_9PROT|nr:aspartate/glutamate racemase family protein [Rhodovibrio salinarum]MBK1699059.1 aspartate/glutamate racemase family protein [Rhodovibrio salinarum]